MSLGPRDLDVAVAAEHDADLDLIEAFDKTGFVGTGEVIPPGGFEGAAQDIVAENLRGLGQNQPLARDRRPDFSAARLRAAHLLDGVHRNDADNRGAAGFGFLDDAADRVQIDEGPDGIVDRATISVSESSDAKAFSTDS